MKPHELSKRILKVLQERIEEDLRWSERYPNDEYAKKLKNEICPRLAKLIEENQDATVGRLVNLLRKEGWDKGSILELVVHAACDEWSRTDSADLLDQNTDF